MALAVPHEEETKTKKIASQYNGLLKYVEKGKAILITKLRRREVTWFQEMKKL